jgi:ABC-type polysaccharide transport system permease subunit
MTGLTPMFVAVLALGAAGILLGAVALAWSGLASFESHFSRGAFASVAFSTLFVWAVSQFDPAALGAAVAISAAVILIVGIYGLSRDAIAWFRGEHTPPKRPFET